MFFLKHLAKNTTPFSKGVVIISKPKVIVISGKARSGKDTAGGMIFRSLNRNGKRAIIMHYADLVKYVCKTFFGWDGQKDEDGRTLLQRVGTDIVRKKDPDYWVRFVDDMIGFFGDVAWDYVIIPDCRFPNELEYMKQYYDVLHLKITRKNKYSQLTDSQKNHPSETSMDGVKPDVSISNDGDFNELYDKIETFLEEYVWTTTKQ